MKVYLVGGAVRDTLLNIKVRDRDYVVVGGTAEEMLASGFEQVGADFPVFLHPETAEEYALARNERKTGPGYLGFEVKFDPSVTLEEDLLRRDLTINSMAMDTDGNIIDPYGGLDDLKNKFLRHTSVAFAEDPVRVLRVARFAARYTEFDVHADTFELMREIVKTGEFATLTPERVWAEFKKGLMETQPSRMFQILEMVGCRPILKEWFGPRCSERYQAMDRAREEREPIEVMFAIAADNFKSKTDYRKWIIPSDCEQVATMVNAEYQAIIRYNELSNTEKVQLFNRVDMFRRPERFELVLHACQDIGRYAEPDHLPLWHLRKDIDRVMEVPVAEIALATEDKTKIKDLIFAARVASLV